MFRERTTVWKLSTVEVDRRTGSPRKRWTREEWPPWKTTSDVWVARAAGDDAAAGRAGVDRSGGQRLVDRVEHSGGLRKLNAIDAAGELKSEE